MGARFVGRQTELLALAGLLDETARGRGGLAMLVGEPGIGKSRLADAVTDEAARRGFRTAWGRAWESGGAPAYFPWTEALAALGLRADASLATAVDGDVARFQLFRTVAGDLRAAASKAPLLIVLDDVHVADVSTLRMLEFVARELRSMKVAIVATRRDRSAGMTPEIESILARISREGQSFVLARLAREEVRELVRDEGPRIPPGTEPEIWRATEGNPLFVSEIVRLLAADPGLATRGSVPVPSSAQEILRQRLDGLDAAARELLEAAAVFGVEAPEDVLAAVSGESPAKVREIAAEAVRAGILVAKGDRRVRFGHALLREALYRDVLPARRRSLHRAIALALEATAAPPLHEIAHHAIEAGPGEALVERTSRAAGSLSAAYADEDAIGLLERALAVVPPDGRDAVEIAILLGSARIRVGDTRGGRASCVRACDVARAIGDGALFARAALAHAAETTQGETDKATHRLLEEALGLLPEGEAGLRVRTRARIAASLQPAPDPEAVARMAEGAIAEARALGDDATLLDVLHNAGAAFGEAVFVPEVVEMARDAVRLAERFGDRAKLFRARIRLVFALMQTGDVAGADANIEAFENETRGSGQPRHMWPAPFLRGMRALQEGRFADADALAEEAKEIGFTSPAVRATTLLHRFARLRAEERGPELLALEPGILAFVAHWNDAGTYTDLMIACIRAFAGDLETSRAHLAKVSLDSTPARVQIALGILADTTVRTGDERRAAEIYERLLPSADQWHVFMFGGFTAEATYARHLGGLAALLDRQADAERHFAEALARAEAASARPECVRILAAHARLLLRAGDEARAHELLARAHPIAAEVGLARLLPALPSPTPSARPPPASSTKTLALARDGETWLVTLGPTTVRLKDSRGLAYVARLVEEPGREVHALDMAGSAEGADEGDAGAVLDAEARAAYKRRLAELDEEMREAEGWNDGARITRARSEIEVLSAELSRAVGAGGRGRRVGSAAERARVAVTRRVKDVVRRIAEQSPELGRHLEATVKTGTFCSYRPI